MQVRVAGAVSMSVLSLVLVVAPVSSASPPGAALWRLDIEPEVSTAATGTVYTLTASVTDLLGNGQDGAMIDFEVLSGPGDDDVGTAGNTPETPDLSCISAGGGVGVPATCAVSYAESDNIAGDDPVVAWIDVDGLDATVEADMAEGLDATGIGASVCGAGTTGAGITVEPDYTDCVVRTWTERTGVTVDVEPEVATVAQGQAVTLTAVVMDPGGPVSNSSVRWFFMPGSPNDPGSPGNSPDATCTTDASGQCSVSYVPTVLGTDTLCALAAGPRPRCDEPVGAPEHDNSADVFERTVSDQLTPTPTPTPTPSPTPTPMPTPTPTPTSTPTPTPTPTPVPAPVPTPGEVVSPGPETTPTPSVSESATPPPTPEPEPAYVPSAAPTAGETDGDAVGEQATQAAVNAGPLAMVFDAAVEGVARVVKPEAAAVVAVTFGFPLALSTLVVVFLMVQGRIDARDPKLRAAPRSHRETVIPFQEEEQL
jgi:hypothetical protein